MQNMYEKYIGFVMQSVLNHVKPLILKKCSVSWVTNAGTLIILYFLQNCKNTSFSDTFLVNFKNSKL